MSALVNGSSRNLLLIGPGKCFGAEILVRFAREGFRLAVISRSHETLKRIEVELANIGVKVLCEVGDLPRKDSIENAVKRVAVEFGSLTCLVYNAKFGTKESGLTISPDALTQSLAVNITGAVIAIQAALPFMVGALGPCVIVTGGGFKDRPDPRTFRAIGRQGRATRSCLVAGWAVA